MGVLEVLTIIFVVLKVLGFITWSWWTVFIPLYIALAIYTVIITLQVILSATIFKKVKKSWHK